jgi:hypothetical protein
MAALVQGGNQEMATITRGVGFYVASAIAGLMLGGVSLNANAQEILSPTFKYRPESVFTASVKSRFADSKFSPVFSFDRAVSVTAIPVLKDPIAEMQELERQPTTIGALYVPTGSLRLKLDPGLYRVELVKKSDRWIVRFLDDKATEKGQATADVRPADKVPVPVATVESSVCYRFDKTVVCI